jgi:hypothetical protein
MRKLRPDQAGKSRDGGRDTAAAANKEAPL